MTIEAPSPAAAQGIVHTRLERMERGFDAAHFLSLIATAEFFSLVFAYIYVAYIVLFRGGGVHGPFVIIGQVVAAMIALAVVWTMYRVRTRLVFPAVGLFVLAFAISYSQLLSPGNALNYTMVPTVASWLAVLWFYAWLAVVLFVFARAGWQVSRLSDSEALIVRGKAPGAVAGYLLRLFGIPAICAWLKPGQRRISVPMFLFATAVFCLLMQGLWNSLFTYLPVVELTSRDVIACYSIAPTAPDCRSDLMILILGAVGFYPALFGFNLLVLAVARYLARRFTRLSLERLISNDPRPPILFLRSFRDDQVRLQKPPRPLFRRLISVGEPRPTLDHVLLEEGTPHGPVVAIGAPGSTPPFGAARTYVTDEEWRDTVSGLCSRAGAVVMTLDETEGVRWELGHLFGQNYERKTLFLLPPRLAPAAEVARVLPGVLTHWRDPSDWAAQISETAQREKRFCIGWYWRDDAQVEVFTSQHDSYLAYLLAVRSFLSHSAARFEPAPVVPADGSPAPAPRPRVYVGLGIMIAIAGIVYLMLTLSALQGAQFFAAPPFVLIVAWALRRTGLPFAVVPLLAVSFALVVLELVPVVNFLVTGQFADQVAGVFVDLAIMLGLIAWTMKAQSRLAVIVLTAYQLVAAAGPVLLLLSGAGALATVALPIVLRICAVAAGVFAVVRLGKANRA